VSTRRKRKCNAYVIVVVTVCYTEAVGPSKQALILRDYTLQLSLPQQLLQGTAPSNTKQRDILRISTAKHGTATELTASREYTSAGVIYPDLPTVITRTGISQIA
jgi:hypothetical protein